MASVVGGGDGCGDRTEGQSRERGEKQKFDSKRSLECWTGARSHRGAQITTSVIFIMRHRRRPWSIVSRWVTRSDIFTLCRSRDDMVASFIIICNLFANQYHSQTPCTGNCFCS